MIEKLMEWIRQTRWTDVTCMPGAAIVGTISSVIATIICTVILAGIHYLIF